MLKTFLLFIRKYSKYKQHFSKCCLFKLFEIYYFDFALLKLNLSINISQQIMISTILIQD